jgi:molecular chaperone DnaK
MSKVIGIDLGTVNSCVSIYEGGQTTVIANPEGERFTPSVIALKNGERKVGSTAKRQQVVNPKETVYIIKRFIGLKYSDAECKEAIKHVTYSVVDNAGNPRVDIEGRKYSPEELSSYIIAYMKKTAEDYLGEEVKECVITTPAYFTNEQREATKLAGEMAGLTVLRVISEPTAALLASNLDLKGEKKILVADIGGGTTDFSVAEVSNELIEIKASDGDMFLGGSDFDLKIANWLISDFKSVHGIDLEADPQARQRIIEAAEKAKIELSSVSQTSISIPYISVNNGIPLHMEKTLSRTDFERLISSNIDNVIRHAKKAISDAGFKQSDLDGILLVGGSCRIPLIQERLEKEIGAQLYKTANFDEAVSCGAAVQGSIIKGDKTDILLLDVTPLTLSIETMGGVATPMVMANTTIPTTKSQIFTTASDNQPSVTIRVAQGERPMFTDNKVIGQFNLDNIPPARRGVPQIDVSFDIDANGILKVTAKDLGTGKDAHITIEQRGSLTDAEIERIKEEAKQYVAEDKAKMEKIEKLNMADSLAFQTEKQIEELSEKLSEDEKTSLSESLDKLKDAVKAQDVESAETLSKELSDKWVPISAKLYQQANPGDGNGTGTGSAPFDFEDLLKKSSPTGETPPPSDGSDDFEEVK